MYSKQTMLHICQSRDYLSIKIVKRFCETLSTKMYCKQIKAYALLLQVSCLNRCSCAVKYLCHQLLLLFNLLSHLP